MPRTQTKTSNRRSPRSVAKGSQQMVTALPPPPPRQNPGRGLPRQERWGRPGLCPLWGDSEAPQHPRGVLDKGAETFIGADGNVAPTVLSVRPGEPQVPPALVRGTPLSVWAVQRGHREWRERAPTSLSTEAEWELHPAVTRQRSTPTPTGSVSEKANQTAVEIKRTW